MSLSSLLLNFPIQFSPDETVISASSFLSCIIALIRSSKVFLVMKRWTITFWCWPIRYALSMFYGYSHLKHEVNEVKSTNSRQEEIFTQFTELLERHHKKEREIAFYADKMCMTSKHLSQVIKDYTGKTALGLIEEYVISEAKSMLLSTTMSIQQISDELKFPSQSVFGKYFKRVAGISPSEYRNRHWIVKYLKKIRETHHFYDSILRFSIFQILRF